MGGCWLPWFRSSKEFSDFPEVTELKWTELGLTSTPDLTLTPVHFPWTETPVKKTHSTNKFMCSLLEADLPLWNLGHFHFLFPDLHAMNMSSSFLLSLSHGIWAFCNNYLKNSLTVLILREYYSVCIWLWSTLSFPDQKIPSEQKLRSFLQTLKAFGCVLHENKPLSILISYNGWWENCTDPKLHICVSCM